MKRMMVAGNWKMNTTSASAVQLAGQLAAAWSEHHLAVDVLACPPFPYLLPVRDQLAGSGVHLGAQDVYHESPGAFTGQVAVEMLLDVGCQSVILGHSERRHVLGETDADICSKVIAARDAGLQVILCVGELLSERESGDMEAVLNRQLSGGLAEVSDTLVNDLIIAYEPVWAIGTGVTASPEQADEAHAFIRQHLTDRYGAEVGASTRILYGGSVKPDNALSLMRQPNVDGALVGGASLTLEQFQPIIEAAVTVTQGSD